MFDILNLPLDILDLVFNEIEKDLNDTLNDLENTINKYEKYKKDIISFLDIKRCYLYYSIGYEFYNDKRFLGKYSFLSCLYHQDQGYIKNILF